MTTRRELIKSGFASGAVLASKIFVTGSPANATESNNNWRMPDEGDPHAATWMAFGPTPEIWGKKLLPVVRENLARIANAIVAYEPVKMLVREADRDAAAQLCDPKVELVVQPLNDLWVRDTGPVFVKNRSGQLGAVGFNFNGWGNKQKHDRDAKVAEFVAGKANATFLKTGLILEGGGVEVDGHGTAIIAESCVLNANRNPGLSRPSCEAELSRLLGLDKIIWVHGIAGKDITEGHIDFYARFASPGVVVAGLDTDPSSYDHAVCKRTIEILRRATDASGRKLKVVVLEAPSTVRTTYENKDFAAGYINFYVVNGAVIAPEFGDAKRDRSSRDALRDLFPGRDIIQLNIDGIAAGGGGIHCATQQQPAL